MSSYEEDIVTDDEKFIKAVAYWIVGCGSCLLLIFAAVCVALGIWIGSSL